MEIKNFWKNKKVIVTGHTGFKGSWLSLWLIHLGAEVKGISLEPHTQPNLFNILNLNKSLDSVILDICDSANLDKEIKLFKPDVIFHLAAQSLVIDSYNDPLATFQTNIIGSANVLNSSKNLDSLGAFVNVTSDKCYDNKEWDFSYREDDELGGYDPYSSSKACVELITKSFRNSYFKDTHIISSVRAGNVIGGGDWNQNRLLKDLFHSVNTKTPIKLRNPNATRPWQHVLDPLNGYLLLAEKIYKNSIGYDQAWNFGPDFSSIITVQDLVNKYFHHFNFINLDEFVSYENERFHEAGYLSLDCSKSKKLLNWYPKYDVDNSIRETARWHLAFMNNENMHDFTLDQIIKFMNLNQN